MIGYPDSSLTWSELIKRTYRETMDDDGLGLAAQLAYYFFLALFPALLFLLALASLFPIATLSERLPAALGTLAAPEMIALLRDQIRQIASTPSQGFISVGLLGALWSSSAALVSIIGALNRAYDIEESRPWWKVRLIAIALTVGLAIFVVTAFTLVVAGPSIGNAVASAIGAGAVFSSVWAIAQWPLAFALVVFAVGLVYYFAPDAEQDWAWVTPGALIATALWLLASLIFRLYVTAFADYQATYGAVGGVIVLLLWLYLSGLAIIVGAEANAELEHASPWGKNPGERKPGVRMKLGAAAARAFRSSRDAAADRPMVPGPVPAPATLPAAEVPRASDWAIALVLRVLWPRVRSKR